MKNSRETGMRPPQHGPTLHITNNSPNHQLQHHEYEIKEIKWLLYHYLCAQHSQYLTKKVLLQNNNHKEPLCEHDASHCHTSNFMLMYFYLFTSSPCTINYIIYFGHLIQNISYCIYKVKVLFNLMINFVPREIFWALSDLEKYKFWDIHLQI